MYRAFAWWCHWGECKLKTDVLYAIWNRPQIKNITFFHYTTNRLESSPCICLFNLYGTKCWMWCRTIWQNLIRIFSLKYNIEDSLLFMSVTPRLYNFIFLSRVLVACNETKSHVIMQFTFIMEAKQRKLESLILYNSIN